MDVMIYEGYFSCITLADDCIFIVALYWPLCPTNMAHNNIAPSIADTDWSIQKNESGRARINPGNGIELTKVAAWDKLGYSFPTHLEKMDDTVRDVLHPDIHEPWAP